VKMFKSNSNGRLNGMLLLVFLLVVLSLVFMLFWSGGAVAAAKPPNNVPVVVNPSSKPENCPTISRDDLVPYVARPVFKAKYDAFYQKLKNHEVKLRHYPWNYFESVYECQMGEDRIGAIGDGGKWICGLFNLLQKPNCVVYSLGSNGDHSFEDDIMKFTKCELHVFDMDDFSSVFKDTRANFHTCKIGDGTKDTKSIPQLMEELGHDHIDVLKIDIEGYEYIAFETLSKMSPQPWIGQILVEKHMDRNWYNYTMDAKYKYVDKVIRLTEIINKLGLVQFHREENPCCHWGHEFSYGNLIPRPKF